MSKYKKNPYHVNYYSKGGVALLPIRILRSEAHINLSWPAKALLIEISSQYNGFNNGDLCATRSMLKDRGFNSSDTLFKAIKQLLNQNLILLTRQGGRDWKTGGKLPSLYAITWQPIDDCKDKFKNYKLDVETTNKPAFNFNDTN